jgi:hypothetical protein
MISKLLENQRLVHIVSEFLILIVLIYYFNQKYKKMLSYIEDLVQRVEEQEDIIQKHDQLLKNIMSQQIQIQQLQSQQLQSQKPQLQPQTQTQSQPLMQQRKQQSAKPKIQKQQQNIKSKVQLENIPQIEELDDIEQNSVIERESNLDVELANELSELDNEVEEIEEVNLKKN